MSAGDSEISTQGKSDEIWSQLYATSVLLTQLEAELVAIDESVQTLSQLAKKVLDLPPS
jgi:hypothetical protein